MRPARWHSHAGGISKDTRGRAAPQGVVAANAGMNITGDAQNPFAPELTAWRKRSAAPIACFTIQLIVISLIVPATVNSPDPQTSQWRATRAYGQAASDFLSRLMRGARKATAVAATIRSGRLSTSQPALRTQEASATMLSAGANKHRVAGSSNACIQPMALQRR